LPRGGALDDLQARALADRADEIEVRDERVCSILQARALADRADAFVTHLDLVPTILDAYGVLDDFAMTPLAARFGGRSLLRSTELRTIPLTNCTDMF